MSSPAPTPASNAPATFSTPALARALPGPLTLALALLASAGVAHASPPLELMGDTLGPGGLQGRTVPSGAGAAYFNPALLTDAPAGASLGFVLLRQQIAITLDGRPGTQFAVPADIANAGHADGSRFDNYPIPTNDLQFGREEGPLQAGFEARPRQGAGSGQETFTYLSLGLAVKLFEERLTLGAHVLLPNGEFTRLTAFYNDEREQYFSNSLHPELYGDRMTAPSVVVGAGLRLTDTISIGAGAGISLAANAVAPTYVVDTGNLDSILIDLDAKAEVAPAPQLAVSYQPLERLRLTATAHAPRCIEISSGFTFLLASGVEQASDFDLTLSYMPWHLGVGAAYDVFRGPDHELTLAATGVYAAWSTYRDRHDERPADAYGWSDTVSPTLGLRARAGALRALFDVSYAPTPVPAQTGRSNYVDHDRLAGALGSELGFALWGADAGIGLQLQAHRLLAQHQSKLPTPTRADGVNAAPALVKDEVPDDAQISGEPLAGAEGLQTNNPGWPGFGSEGWLLAASLYLRVSP